MAKSKTEDKITLLFWIASNSYFCVSIFCFYHFLGLFGSLGRNMNFFFFYFLLVEDKKKCFEINWPLVNECTGTIFTPLQPLNIKESEYHYKFCYSRKLQFFSKLGQKFLCLFFLNMETSGYLEPNYKFFETPIIYV